MVLEVMALIVGFLAMVLASRSAVTAGTELAVGSNVPPFVIGLTLLAVGTDLPEFANSLASSFSDHGDINVGDSVGSAATQMTLVLGLLPLIVGSFVLPKSGVALAGCFTAAGLGVLAIVLGDGNFSRVEAALMLTLWALGSFIIHHRAGQNQQLELPQETRARGPLLAQIAVAFCALAFAANVALWGIVGIAERFGAPEFLVGFFLAAFGTSLPELVFDITAIRRGAIAMAIGDVVGSSFVDATASVAIGPLFFPTDVTTSQVVPGILAAAVAILTVTLILSRVQRHDWRSGILLLVVYGVLGVVLL